MRRWLLLILLFITVNQCTFATHIRAGEITYKQISALTYQFTIVEYVKESSGIYRPKLTVDWGDNTTTDVSITDSTLLSNDTRMRMYVGVHTFAGTGTFIISITDDNRNAGIINIPGDSSKEPFYVETLLNITPGLGYNQSPVLLNPPLDMGAVHKIFTHNPAAYDPDGDILRYSLTKCRDRSASNQDTGYIPGYFLPPANPGKFVTVDSLTGDLTWDAPLEQGLYNFAMKIEEWRNGRLIGYVVRDLQVDIGAANNDPPVVIANDTCVEAGTNLVLNVKATDPNNNAITLTAYGGPLVDKPNPATFNVIAATAGLTTAQFSWQTECRHIQAQPYELTLKAEDDGNGGSIKLVAIRSVKIRVLLPAPKNLSVTPLGNTITVTWNKSVCPLTTGYKLYRKNGPAVYNPAVCDTGLPASTGYMLIATLKNINDTSYLDNNYGLGLSRGNIYCYRAVAYYPNTPVDSVPHDVESKASNESCAVLKRDLPVMVRVSVVRTDLLYGIDTVRWVKPVPGSAGLDTAVNKQPYVIALYRSKGFNGSNATLVHTFPARINFKDIDTLYVDSIPQPAAPGQQLNTEENPYTYYVKLYSSGNDLGNADIASSLFLTLSPTDNKIKLSWTRNAPWNTRQYDVYKEYLSAPGQFVKIGSTTQTTYDDSGIANLIKHRYYVQSIDTFSENGFPKPLTNNSQIAEAAAIDNISPCAPVLTVTPECENYLNKLEWTNPNTSCADDVLKFYIYHRAKPGDVWPQIPLDSIISNNGPFTGYTLALEDSGLVHTIAGCYSVVAIDSVGNRSPMSNAPCVDNCPLYRIPKYFTPDGDGLNDLLKPRKGYRYIEGVNIKIFDRWGMLMFETHDIDINWDGKDQRNGRECSDGVYFYIAEVQQTHLEGPEKVIIKGFVEIFRNRR